MLSGYLIFFPETPVHICCPRFNWLVCLSLLDLILLLLNILAYILDTSPSLDMWTADTFSHSVACLSLLRVSEHEWKTLTLIKSNFSVFYGCSNILSFRNFLILAFTIRLTIYLKLTWVRWEVMVWFVFLHMPNRLMLILFIEMPIFPPLNSGGPSTLNHLC